MEKQQINWRYLLQEAILFLLLSYLVLFGGTFNGVILLPLNQANLVLVGLVGGGWLIWRWLRRRPFPRTALDPPVLLVLMAYGIATLTSTDPRRSAEMLVQLALYALAFYLLVDLLRAGLPAELLVKTLLLSSLVMVLGDLTQIGAWYSGWLAIGGLTHPVPPVTLRISAFLGHPNFVAAYFNLLLPLALVRTLQARGRAARLGWLAYGLVALFLVFFTSSRGGWLGTAAALGIGLVLLALDRRQALLGWWGRLRHRRLILGLGGVVAVAVLLAGVGLLAWQSRNPSHASSGLNPQARTYIWSVAWEMFRSAWLTGHGPFTFGTEFIRTYSVPPSMLLAHAHNVIFNTAAETGLLGAMALLGLLAGLSALVWRRWRTSQGNERLAVAGLAAGLGGLLVHSLFDTPGLLPAITLVAVCLAAMLAAEEPPRQFGRVTSRLAGGAVMILWVGVISALGWRVWVYQPYIQGVEAANRGDWQAAAARLDEAARRDPALALNWFQAGFAHGQLALSSQAQAGAPVDQAGLSQAIQDYQRGLALEPVYPTNRANLALLEWAAGKKAEALADMRTAADSAQGQPAFRLTLGRMLEATGQQGSARQAYQTVLKQIPGWAKSYFFRATAFRQSVLKEWQSAQPDAVQENAALPDEMALKTATFAQSSADAEVQNQLAWGRLYSRRGESQAAVDAYEKVITVLGATSSFGVGQMGNSQYAWYVYYRDAIAADLLPGLDYILYTDDIVTDMLDMAAAYEKLGDAPAAQRIYRQILAVAPDCTPASQKLDK